MNHYHIKWSSKEVLDWEAFGSRAEAETAAQQLVRWGETYTIEERDEACPRCWKSLQSKAPETNPNETYPWQQAVLDALVARPEERIRKINAAQRQISARLVDQTPSDLNEQAALHDALRTLRSLLQNSKSGDKKQIA